VPGSHYSPIPSKADVRYSKLYDDYKGIKLNLDKQVLLLKEISIHYKNHPFASSNERKGYFYFDNSWFSYSDALSLYCMIMHYRPKNIIELGSGFSTACILDISKSEELDIQLDSYDKDSMRLKNLVPEYNSIDNFNYHSTDIREIELQDFSTLSKGDMLLIDSSHVSKYGSELHRILFDIIPDLNEGVIIMFHDVFRNFEYPKPWLDDGIYWNEQYILRAFLQYNSAFNILLFTDLLEHEFEEWYRDNMPLALKLHDRSLNPLKSTGSAKGIRGQSIWLQKSLNT